MAGLERTIFPIEGRLGGCLPSAKSDFGALMRKSRQAARLAGARTLGFAADLNFQPRSPFACKRIAEIVGVDGVPL